MKCCVSFVLFENRYAALPTNTLRSSLSNTWRGRSQPQERKTPLTQKHGWPDARGQGPASLAQSLAWYALARTGTDASRGQGGRTGGRNYTQEVAGGRTRTWTLKLPTICYPLSLPKVSRSRSRFPRCHFIIPIQLPESKNATP